MTISYELAKELKEGSKWVSAKPCSDCDSVYLGGHKSFRCKPCQKLARKSMRHKWDKKHYEANREEILTRHVEHQRYMRQVSPYFRTKEILKYHKRQALIRGNGGSFSLQEWEELKAKQGNRCAKCKEEKKLTIDHIIPLSKGGKNIISNIQPLCGSCNSSKGAKIYA